MSFFKSEEFGKLSDGRSVTKFTLEDGLGNEAHFINYGAALQALYIKDSQGVSQDVVLGYDSAEEYELGQAYFGCVVGRCTNRIASSSFTLGGRTYQLSPNRGTYHIHGGIEGLSKKLWSWSETDKGVLFSYLSPDGEEGYPGNLKAEIHCFWAAPGVLRFDYDCVSDKDTVINLTNHSYFNLDGHSSGSTLEHSLQLFSDSFALADTDGIPTGQLAAVLNTPLDFISPHSFGERIEEGFPPIVSCGGYDHNFILSGKFNKAAVLKSNNSGICMTLFTDAPDLGLYNACGLDSQRGKGGASYGRFHGVCLETQYLPNAVNLADFEPKPIFKAGEHFNTVTEFHFTAE